MCVRERERVGEWVSSLIGARERERYNVSLRESELVCEGVCVCKRARRGRVFYVTSYSAWALQSGGWYTGSTQRTKGERECEREQERELALGTGLLTYTVKATWTEKDREIEWESVRGGWEREREREEGRGSDVETSQLRNRSWVNINVLKSLERGNVRE